MSGDAKFLAVVVALMSVLSMARTCAGREDAKVEKRCEAACSPMAYTGFHDEGGCWCRVEDPNTLKRGK